MVQFNCIETLGKIIVVLRIMFTIHEISAEVVELSIYVLVSIYGRLELRSQSGSEQDKNSKCIYLEPL